MPGRVCLSVVRGKMRGKSYVFDEHDTFLFGRMLDCHAWIRDDPKVSRHHFIVEANPPDACIRDLGSMNGTYVNGARHGGREKGESPEEGARQRHPEVDLADGDEIRAGGTVFRVAMEIPVVCSECGGTIPDDEKSARTWVAGAFLCGDCEARLKSVGKSPSAPGPVRCQKCDLDVSMEVPDGRSGDYICEACRLEVREDPVEALPPKEEHRYEPGGPKIEGYRLKKKLGLGSYGAVYLGERETDGARVAVKVMLSRVAVDRKARDRFRQEIELMKGMRHENLVALLDHGSEGSIFYFIMEHCDGGSLRTLMDERYGKVPIDVAGPIMLQALAGLACAHENGVVHRDLKPSNILLTGSEGSWTAKVSDMGLAKNFGQAGLSGMTITGSAGGTPLYMPREQLTNFKYVKPVSDIWSMGATFYHMVTGRGPRRFPKGRDPVDVVLNDDVIPVRNAEPEFPKKLAKVIDRSLAVHVKDRYQTANEMRDALEKAL